LGTNITLFFKIRPFRVEFTNKIIENLINEEIEGMEKAMKEDLPYTLELTSQEINKL